MILVETRRTVAANSHVGDILVLVRIVGTGEISCSGVSVLITREVVLSHRVANEEALGVIEA